MRPASGVGYWCDLLIADILRLESMSMKVMSASQPRIPTTYFSVSAMNSSPNKMSHSWNSWLIKRKQKNGWPTSLTAFLLFLGLSWLIKVKPVDRSFLSVDESGKSSGRCWQAVLRLQEWHSFYKNLLSFLGLQPLNRSYKWVPAVGLSFLSFLCPTKRNSRTR